MGGRRMFKAAAVLIALGYCSLLVYQGGVTFNSQESRAGSMQVSDLSIELVTKPVTKLVTTTVTKPVTTPVTQPVNTSVIKPVIKSKTKPVTKGIFNSEQKYNLSLDDIFISVKTTRHYQYTRLPIILKTWYQLAEKQIWFFTDTVNHQHQNQTNGHMVNTNCSATHERKHLCCKMSSEYDHFLQSGKKWFCHFDDDNYVNVPRLVSVLQTYNHQRDWYLGKPSVTEPVKIYKELTNRLLFSFWFATGGAGFCISSSLALKMLPLASGGRFITVCERIRFPDDVTVGFIIEHMLKTRLTLVPEFHSHLEQMKLLAPESFRDHISFSFSNYKNESNILNVPGFDMRYDPTRFLSLHCFLFPHFEFCPR